MPYKTNLSSLTPREAIVDAVYRGVVGVDRNDIDLFTSAFAGEDVSFELHGDASRSIQGLSDILKDILGHIGPMDTTHMVTNVRVDVEDGADTASLTSNFLAQHCPPGQGKDPGGRKFLVGGEYLVDLVKDERDGIWKVKKWVVDSIWAQGDRTVMQRASG